ncbi:MAG: potassium channel protein [Candidatus Scalindua sp.]|jgi:voltage-gated potassium channel|nr:potassium channel protein [Candidatus Scalindua sp.]MBT5303920.1 potassium channel protein [Candidatus Scalindua sp.]MBT6047813.1 potassium channel protein [Candidatus Scalindua sp.]MBT6560941.1 potassium channel protein [Candidatus Scalindua sp.]MBT7210586.1 potassium channel protein [Candidatus Scalindua sp.]
MQNSEITFRKKLILSLVLFIVVLSSGTAGYSIIEGWNIFDSLYMTVITFSTVGFHEIEPLSKAGKAFTIGLIFFSLGVVAYALNYGLKAIFEGEIQDVFGRRKLKKVLESLENHYIVCGYGRMGKVICNELKQKGIPFVIVEKEPLELDIDDDVIITYGDATRDDLLKSVGIEKAKGLISVLDSDAQNLYVVLSARGLNKDLFIVTRANEEGADYKLTRAGADKVVSPYHIGGIRIAHTILKPTVVDFLELTAKAGNMEIQIEEVVVEEASALAGKTIKEADIRAKNWVVIVALKKKDGKIIFNPRAHTLIEVGDKVAVIGEPEHFNQFEKMAMGNRKSNLSEESSTPLPEF